MCMCVCVYNSPLPRIVEYPANVAVLCFQFHFALLCPAVGTGGLISDYCSCQHFRV